MLLEGNKTRPGETFYSSSPKSSWQPASLRLWRTYRTGQRRMLCLTLSCPECKLWDGRTCWQSDWLTALNLNVSALSHISTLLKNLFFLLLLNYLLYLAECKISSNILFLPSLIKSESSLQCWCPWPAALTRCPQVIFIKLF